MERISLKIKVDEKIIRGDLKMNSKDKFERDDVFYSIVDQREGEIFSLIENVKEVNFQDNHGNSYLHGQWCTPGRIRE